LRHWHSDSKVGYCVLNSRVFEWLEGSLLVSAPDFTNSPSPSSFDRPNVQRAVLLPIRRKAHQDDLVLLNHQNIAFIPAGLGGLQVGWWWDS
jgi:hypothetical protein